MLLNHKIKFIHGTLDEALFIVLVEHELLGALCCIYIYIIYMLF